MRSSTLESSRSPESAIADADRLLGVGSIDRIAEFDPGGLPIVSIYLTVPPGPDAHAAARTKGDSLLHEIRDRGEDRSLGHDARLSLRRDIEQLAGAIASASITPGTFAFFSCSGAGLFEVVRLPRAVRDRIIVDATPWIRPMLAVLGDYRRCCVVVVDRRTARGWELYLGRVRELTPIEQLRAPRSSDAKAPRDSNRAEELEKRHFRQVAGVLERLQKLNRYDVLAVGGHDSERPRFLGLLSDSLRERVGGTFSVDDDAIAPATVCAQGEAILDRYELDRQRRLVSELLATEAAGGHAVSGLQACLWAGSIAAIADLYVHDGAIEPGVVCSESHWLAQRGEKCPICGGRTRETPDVLDELAEAVIDAGAAVHTVRAETELSDTIAACSLRFVLPPKPEPAQAGTA
jgi:peptide chain release factor subunit 1